MTMRSACPNLESFIFHSFIFEDFGGTVDGIYGGGIGHPLHSLFLLDVIVLSSKFAAFSKKARGRRTHSTDTDHLSKRNAGDGAK